MRTCSPAVLGLLVSLHAMAQFSGMATDHEGSRLFFTTDLSQRGSDQPGWGKLFIADEKGVRSLLVRNRDVFRGAIAEGPFANGETTNFYNINGVDVSSDASVLAVSAVRVCQGYTSGLCRYSDQTTVYNQRGETVVPTDGRLVLSPSGQWALQLRYPLWVRSQTLRS